MPRVTVDDGVQLHYSERGEGDQTVVFSHSYLVDQRHFEPQLAALEGRYRVLAYDHRGHGQSDKPARGYSMERIYADGVAVVEALGRGPVHWVGLSTGGFVGMRIAFRRPELLGSVTLMDTSAASEPLLPFLKYHGLLLALRVLGFGPVLGPAMDGLFGRAFIEDPARADERAEWRRRLEHNDVGALIGFGRAIWSRDDVVERLRGVTLPTLVIHGEDDRAIPPARARQLAAAIPGARLEPIPRGGHLCTVEEPAAVNEVLLDFLARQAG